MIWFTVVALMVPFYVTEDAPVHWDSRIHQYTIVKATALMPDFLQRQILRHRGEILQGCVEALGELAPGSDAAALAEEELHLLIRSMASRTPYSAICRRMGRLSAFLGEVQSPLRSLDARSGNRVNSFVLSSMQRLPVVISRIGEKPLFEQSIRGYMDSIVVRNTRRTRSLQETIARESYSTWPNERSRMYGLIQLLYNDMISDTARLWLHAWQQAGGSIEAAPYFQDNAQPERKR